MKKNVILIISLFLLVSATHFGWRILEKHSNFRPVDHATHKEIYYCPMHPHYISDHPGNCPICDMKLVKKEIPSEVPVGPSASKRILYWTDPMIPGYKADGPGKSPMGMELVPVYEESTIRKDSGPSIPGYSTVAMNIEKQQLIGVKTAPVTKKILTKTIHAYGHVAHDLALYEAQLEYINAWREYSAFVIRRPVKEDFRVDWWKYDVTESSERWHSVDKIKAQQRLVKAEYELRHMGLTDTQLTQLREVKYGQPWVQPDLLFFSEGHGLWIYAQIPEMDLGFVDVGQKAVVTIPAYGETTEGVVRNVSLMVEPDTRSTQVRIELPKYRGELKVNMYTQVDFPVELDNSLVVPREAVMDTGLNKIVFVQAPDQAGVFEPRRIQTGFEGDGMVVVKSGLKEGETIVVSGNFLLDSESRLQGSLAEDSHHD